MMYGMPWPGEYLIAPDGTVRDKLFLRNYEHRPSASQVVLRHFGADAGGNSVEIKTGRAHCDSDACRPIVVSRAGTGGIVGHTLKPGWHIYGKPLPGNYQPTELMFDGPIVDGQSLEFPPPKPMLLKALGETLPVYGGEIRALGKLGIKWSPPAPAKFLEPFGKRIEPGPYKIGGTLRFQTCSDEICEAPQAIKFELPLTVEAGIPPAPKKTA